MKRTAIVISCIVLLFSGSLTGATLKVPSKYATIQAAIDASASGDTILVADGIYSAASSQAVINGKNSLTLMSESGRDAAILDGSHDIVSIISSSDIRIIGLTARNGGGAMIAINSSSLVRVLDCRVYNSSEYGIWIDGSSQDVYISNSVIEQNSRCGIAAHGSNINISSNTIRNNLSGIEYFWSAWNLNGTIESNDISNNTTGILFGTCPGGSSSSVIITANLICRNDSYGIVVWEWQSLDISNNTIARNGSYGIYVASGSPDLNHNIICANEGAGVAAGLTSNPTIACNDVWGNSHFANGNYVGFITDQTGYNNNISTDPFFCNTSGGDYSLAANSPALHASCGPMGAIATPGCSNQTAVQQITWGAIKELFK